MKRITLIKTSFLLSLLLFLPIALNAQLTAVVASGLPNIGRGEMRIADFNNDGNLDVLIIGQTTAYSTLGGTIGFYLGNGNGTFSDATSTWFPTAPTAVSGGIVGIADYDKDGDIDFVYAGRTNAAVNVIYLYKNTGTTFENNTTAAFTGTTAPTGFYTGSIQWGDIDNDGDLDLLINGRTYTSLTYPTSSSHRGNVLQIYKNDGDGTFTQSYSSTSIGVCYGQALFIDFENDGDLDIYYSGGGNIGGYMINDGTGTYGAATSNNTTRASNMSIADFNKDGILDLLQSYVNTNSTPATAFRILYNTSTTSAINLAGTSYASAILGVGGTTSTTNMGVVSSIDYDADGDMDFTVQGMSSSSVPTTYLFLNDGATSPTVPAFTEAALGLTGLHYGGAIWADLNNDNKPDLITFGYSDASASTSQTKVYLNETPTVNLAPSAPSSINAVTSAVATLTWTMPVNADDHTLNVNLTYNVRIGTTSGASDILNTNVYGPGKYTIPSAVVKNLLDGTYYWSVQAVDGANVAGAWATESTFVIGNPTTTPIVQASNISLVANTTSSINLSWKNGDGYKTAVFAKLGNSTSDLAEPVANTVYTANATFGSGSPIGSTGWYCVYNGSVTPLGSNSVNVTGLSALTNYQFMVVSYNGSGDNSIINYLTNAGTNNPVVLSSADYTVPTIITSALTVSAISGSHVQITPSQSGTIGWNGPHATVVFMKQGSDETEDVPLVANTTYTGNTQFGLGTQVGSGWYCVYNGNSSYLGSGNFNPFPTFSGLSVVTPYVVRACTYSGTPGLEKYSATAVVSFTTLTTAIASEIKAIANIYPTLTRDVVYVEGNVKTIDIFSLTGQKVNSLVANGTKTLVNMSNLSSGAYIIRANMEDGSANMQNVILQK